MWNKLLYFFRNLNRQHRVSVENPHTGDEMWYIIITPLRVLIVLGVLILLLVLSAMMVVTYTRVSETIPGSAVYKSRAKITLAMQRIDTLQSRLDTWNDYYKNIATILEGRTPANPDLGADSVKNTQNPPVAKIEEDSILRLQLELEGIYKSGAVSPVPSASRDLMGMIAPLKGEIIRRYDPRDGVYGVELVSMYDQPILAVREGTVIYAGWSPQQGYVLAIQHSGNMVSFYRNSSQMIRSIGDRVKSGEVLGQASRAVFTFELWYDGAPVDPLNYIVF